MLGLIIIIIIIIIIIGRRTNILIGSKTHQCIKSLMPMGYCKK